MSCPMRIFANMDNHGKNIIMELHDHYKNNLYTDFTVKLADGKNIQCHRCILAATIPFIKVMLSSGMKEGIEREVKLDGIDPFCAEAIIGYCYSGTMEVPWEKMKEMVNAAEFLQFKEVKEHCDRFLSWKVSREDAQEWYSFAHQFELTDTISNIEHNFLSEITGTVEFLNRTHYDVYNICSKQPKISWSNTPIIACLKWLAYDFAERKSHIQELFDVCYYTESSKILDAIEELFTVDERSHFEELLPEMHQSSEDRKRSKNEYHKSSLEDMVVVIYRRVNLKFKYIDIFNCKSGSRNIDLDDAGCVSLSMDTEQVLSETLADCSICPIPNGVVLVGGGANIQSHPHTLYKPVPFVHFFTKEEHCAHMYRSEEMMYHKNQFKSHALLSLPSARFDHGCDVIGSTMYVFGGREGDPRGLDLKRYGEYLPTLSVEALHLEKKEWIPKADMPKAVINPQSFVVGHEMYVLGSHDGKAVFLKYNAFKDSWEELKDPPFERTCAGSTGAVIENEIFCMACDKKDNSYQMDREPVVSDARFACYDVLTKEWSITDNRAIEYIGRYCMIKVNEALYCITTTSTQHRYRDCQTLLLWQFDHDVGKWEELDTKGLPGSLMEIEDGILGSIRINIDE